MEEKETSFPQASAKEARMKIQVDEGVVEVVVLPKGDIRLTVGEIGSQSASVSMTSREVQVVIAALESARDDWLA